MILNLKAGGGVGLDADAVVEIPCVVGANGPVPQPVPQAQGHMLGLMQSVKAVERLVIEAVATGSEAAALEAFALHPLVDSVNTARALLDGYRRASPEIDAPTARLAMPPGPEPMPSAHTSVPGSGSRPSPVKMMSRNTVPCRNTSNSGSSGCPGARRAASGSKDGALTVTMVTRGSAHGKSSFALICSVLTPTGDGAVAALDPL